MPDMTPVGNTIIPPNPQTGIQTMSGILGLKQQQQALQTGQFTQQTAQADAQQAQQKNAELQKAQSLALDGARSGRYTKPDGSLDRQKFADDISTVAPTYGQGVASSLLSQANEVIQNTRAHQDLSRAQQGQMGSAFGALAAKPDLSNSDFIDTMDTLMDQNKDPSFRRMGLSMLTHVPPNASPQQLQQLARRWSISSTNPESATSQTTPSVTTMQSPAGLQAINTNPQAAGGVGPVGRPMKQGIAPQILSTPAGPLAATGPSGTTATPLSVGAPGGPNLNPTASQQAATMGQTSGITGRVQQAQSAANGTIQAQDALTRARAILDNPNAPNTGAMFSFKQAAKNVLAGAGIDTGEADDANTLVKNLARYEASRATQAGLGGTDAARELSHAGSPHVALDNAALKGIVTQSLASEKALSAYANVQAKTQDPAAQAKNEADFRNIPNLVQGYEYGLARSTGEADQFLAKHGLTKAQMGKTREMIKEFEARQ